MAHVTESDVESAALEWLEATGWPIAHGPDISPAGETLTLGLSRKKRRSYSEIMHPSRQRMSPGFGSL